jgi:isocitrate dehydrogenase (NAD+)
MVSHEVTVVPGDSELATAAAQRLVEAVGVEVRWDEPSTDATHSSLLQSAHRTKAVLMGWQKGGRDRGELPPAVKLRNDLGVFAQIRPIYALAGLDAPAGGPVDVLVVRETTEDVYANMEHETIPGVFESLKVTTRAACERIARYAFELARMQRRTKVTIVHKANIMKLSDGLFMNTARDVASAYPDIDVEDCIVDALCMHLVRDPTQFDVLLCGNLFGDIVADLCCGLVGGASNAPSINVAKDGTVLFTAGHGDPPGIAGTPNANPLPVVLPAVHILRHLGERPAGDRLLQAVEGTLQAGEHPISLGGSLDCAAFTDAVAGRL